jgi:hypothetical protein
MANVMNMYRAKRGKAKRPSAPVRRTRVGVRSYALAVSEIRGAA